MKQGGILSPVLFCVYYDELLRNLRRSRVGCFLGQWFIGALAYADDVVLLAPSATAMRKLLAICDGFAADFNLSFNANKSQCMYFPPVGIQRTSTLPVFQLNGNDLKFVEQYKHLGHIITADLTDHDDITQRRNVLIGQINKLVCHFGRLDVITKNRLFTAYCTSHYGAELWDLNCTTLDAYGTAWRTGLRNIWRLPRNSHGNLVSLLSFTVPVLITIQQRFVNFAISCLQSTNALLRYVIRHSLLNEQMSSYVTRNLFLCCESFGCDVTTLLADRISSKKCTQHFHKRLSLSDIYCVRSAAELIFARDRLLELDLSPADIDIFLSYFLT